MILLITASRIWVDPIPVVYHLNLAWNTAVHDQGGKLYLMHGDCPTGGDRIARVWCGLKLPNVHELRRPAAWTRHDSGCGRPRRYGYCPGPQQTKCNNAGFRRNDDMIAEVRDNWAPREPLVRVLAFIRGNSRGATHCADQAEAAGLKVDRVPWPHPAHKPAA